MKKVYIKSFHTLSALSEAPELRKYISPIEARRMSSIMKKIVVTSSEALSKAGLECPDAIIAGTGLGCVENTEALLMALTGASGLPLRPTDFMQSTHNTIASLIAIRTRCHGYNVTYSHHFLSFESALMDGWMRIALGRSRNALVIAAEETSEVLSMMLAKVGYGNDAVSDTAVSIVLTDSPEGALCELESVTLLPPSGGAKFITRDDIAAKYGENLCVTALGVCDEIEKIASGESNGAVIYNSSPLKEGCATIKLAALCGGN